MSGSDIKSNTNSWTFCLYINAIKIKSKWHECVGMHNIFNKHNSKWCVFWLLLFQRFHFILKVCTQFSKRCRNIYEGFRIRFRIYTQCGWEMFRLFFSLLILHSSLPKPIKHIVDIHFEDRLKPFKIIKC